MLKDVLSQMKTAIMLLFLVTLITGIIYPLLVTVFAQLFFPWQANGSMIEQNGKMLGSLHIGQSFTDDKYFWGRPSATTPYPYNSAASSGSNMGPSNPDFLNAVKDRVTYLKQFNQNKKLVPVDLVTASASGLDPDISPLAVYYQIPRIAKNRHMSEYEIETRIKDLIKTRTFGILGEPHVNVLQLNIALDSAPRLVTKPQSNQE